MEFRGCGSALIDLFTAIGASPRGFARRATRARCPSVSQSRVRVVVGFVGSWCPALAPSAPGGDSLKAIGVDIDSRAGCGPCCAATPAAPPRRGTCLLAASARRRRARGVAAAVDRGGSRRPRGDADPWHSEGRRPLLHSRIRCSCIAGRPEPTPQHGPEAARPDGSSGQPPSVAPCATAALTPGRARTSALKAVAPPGKVRVEAAPLAAPIPHLRASLTPERRTAAAPPWS